MASGANGTGESEPGANRASASDLVKIRTVVRKWWETGTDKPANLVGLAVSGGGIRSATFALGLIEALARSSRDALAKIDIVSSVSGGGYVSCFLRSLFMPSTGRGIVPEKGSEALDGGDPVFSAKEIEDQYAFARAVFDKGVNEQTIDWSDKNGKKETLRNPLWWLREHGRYLAPNGATDYFFAAAYLIRNWVAMVYIFFLASLAVSALVVLLEAFLVWKGWLPSGLTWLELSPSAPAHLPCTTCMHRILPVSPLLLLGPALLVCAVVISIAYWMTQAMSPNEPRAGSQRLRLLAAVVATLAIAAIVYYLAFRWAQPAVWPIPFSIHLSREGQFAWIFTGGLVLAAAGAALALCCAALALLFRKGTGLTIWLRQALTNCSAKMNLWLLVVVVVGLVDSAGAALDLWFRYGAGGSYGSFGVAILPAVAFLIHKLPSWVGGGASTGGVVSLLKRFTNVVAFVAGIVLYGMVAIAAGALVDHFAWTVGAWVCPVDWPRLLLTILIALGLAVLAGTATGFINLSSLHLLYASRLTRAYLGATNKERLVEAARSGKGFSIKNNNPDDYIQVPLYSRADLPAPLHIINTTMNETVDPQSQIVARDRKGEILSVEPGGVRVADELAGWKDIGRSRDAEHLSLGQWMAISGAAASSGMGRLTNLGLALAMTFANIRLGYWWWSPGVCRRKSAVSLRMRLFARVFGTFVYLFNEMTARYSRGYMRKYLTDGGHFENTGAYRLIQRRVPLILLTDDGADPDYAFADLEELVRKVRLDMGGEVEILKGDDLRLHLAGFGTRDLSIFVDPAANPAWQDDMAARRGEAFVLVLRVRFEAEDLHIFWVKPRFLPNLPPDVHGYGSANTDFPQQSTGNQFFDEAQWESYRRLGEESMNRLLDACPTLLA